MDPSGFELPFLVTLMAGLIWLLGSAPLRHLAVAARAFWGLARPSVTEERDLGVPVAPGGTWPTRLVVAALLGVGLFGCSLAPTTVEFYAPRTPAEEALFQRFNPLGWNGAPVTGSVAGFPWQGIEGCPRGAWSFWASRARTSYAAWFNYACCCLLGGLVAWWLPRRWLAGAWFVAGVLAALGAWAALLWCVAQRD